MITRSLIQLAADLRIGDGETALTGPAAVVLERIAKTAKVLVVRYAPNAPDAIHDEAFVRVAGWLYDAGPDQSTPGGPTALRSSGAASILGPYRVRRGGVIGQAVEEAVAAAAPGNPVTDVTVAGSILTVTYASGETVERQLPEGGGEAAPGGLVSLDVRLPLAPVAMRVGWSQSKVMDEDVFVRADSHPEDGVAVGFTQPGVAPPPYPPAHDDDGPDPYAGIWLATDAAISDIKLGQYSNSGGWDHANRAALEVEGVAGYYYASIHRLAAGISAYVISISLIGDGPLILSEDDVEDWAKVGDATPIPGPKLVNAPGGGGDPVDVVSDDSAAGPWNIITVSESPNPDGTALYADAVNFGEFIGEPRIRFYQAEASGLNLLAAGDTLRFTGADSFDVEVLGVDTSAADLTPEVYLTETIDQRGSYSLVIVKQTLAQREVAELEAIVTALASTVDNHRQLPADGDDGQFVGRVENNPAWVDPPASGGGPVHVGGVVLAGLVNPEDDAFDVNAYENIMLHVNMDVTRPDINWDAHIDATIRKEALPLGGIDALSEGVAARVAASLSLSATGHLLVSLSASSELVITGSRVDVWGF